jgi:hypothetical protein
MGEGKNESGTGYIPHKKGAFKAPFSEFHFYEPFSFLHRLLG